ncbi:glycosyltransferase [Belnapia sp. T6]|uniref:Glycosyltransferase n=1 Tax=Belnapia mucosa TaxID=2804532 RepID=A0ABS1VFA1_9PROT|nr:glycosyltransferase [Belnapia mucosa]
MRLAIFVDQVFWRDGDMMSTDESYVLFLASFLDVVDEIVLIGRLAPEPGRAPYLLGNPAIRLCPLPYYPNLYELWRHGPGIYRRALATVRREAAGQWDALLVCGPHPLGQLIARQCSRFGIPVALIVRQNLIQQMNAHRGLKRLAALAAATLLEWDFKRLARGRTVFTVGTEMAEEYARFTGRVHNHFPCLVDDGQFRAFSAMPAGADPARLLCVCRLAPEKGHVFLFDALARLRERGVAFHLDLVGTGALEAELKSRARAMGLEDAVTFHGYVPYGPELLQLYQQAGVMVLSSLTEGFPQVINESLSIGIPTVATTVGGIPAFLADGQTALLVPPRDSAALAAALERAINDQVLRQGLRERGRALMSANTLEANRSKVMGAIRHEVLAARA